MKRYTVDLSAFFYARNDVDAKVKAAKIAEFLRTLEDSEAQVTSLHETPFASLDGRLVHKGNLTIFENKLIQT